MVEVLREGKETAIEFEAMLKEFFRDLVLLANQQRLLVMPTESGVVIAIRRHRTDFCAMM